MGNIFNRMKGFFNSSCVKGPKEKKGAFRERLLRLEDLETRTLLTAVPGMDAEAVCLTTSPVADLPAPALVTSASAVLEGTDVAVDLAATQLEKPVISDISSINKGSFYLIWVGDPNASGYQIDYSKTDDFAEFESKQETNTTTVISNLRPGTTYYVRVKSLGTGEYSDSDYSDTASTTTPTATLATPTFAMVSVKNATTLTCYWSPVTDADSYTLEYSTYSDFRESSYEEGIHETTHDLKWLYSETTYYLRVKAVGEGYIDSEYSEAKSATTGVGTQLSSTTIQSVTSDNPAQLWVSWSAVENAHHYELCYGQDGQYSKPIWVDGTEGMIEGLLPATTYDIRIQAVGEGNWTRSEYAVGKGTTHDAFILDAPANLTLTNQTPSSVYAKWDAVDNASGYQLEYFDGESWTEFALTVTEWTANGLTPETDYQFRVKALGSLYYADSDYSPEVSITTMDRYRLETPVLEGKAEDVKTITVAWNEIEHADCYRLVYALNEDFTDPVISMETGLTATITDLLPNQHYYFKVQAVGSGDYGESDFSAVLQITTPKVILSIPTLMSVTAKDSATLKAEWTAVDFASSYTLEYATDKNFATAVSVTGLTGTSVYLSELDPMTTYFVRVKAIGTGIYEDSDYSNVLSAITPRIVLETPEMDAVYDGGMRITALWDAIDNASRYEILYADNIHFDRSISIKTADATVTSYQITNLNPNQTYYIKVRALGSGIYQSSAYSDVQSVSTDDVWMVTSAEDNGAEGTLRFVLDRVTNDGTIRFAESLNGQTITLAGSQLDISKNVTIDASSLTDGVTINANELSRVFFIHSEDEIYVTLKNLTVTGGCGEGYGGGIYTFGSVGVTLEDCKVIGNVADGGAGNGYGGGIYACGQLNLTRTFLSENMAKGAQNGWGGGLYLNDGAAVLEMSQIDGNTALAKNGTALGGGIYNFSAQVQILNSQIAGNEVQTQTLKNALGGGLYNSSIGNVGAVNSAFVDNVAAGGDSLGGGLYNAGELTLNNATIAGNKASGAFNASKGIGGGLYLASGNASMVNSILAENTAKTESADIAAVGGSLEGEFNLSSFTAWNEKTSSGNIVYDASLPLFTDAAAGDYSLCADSQAIDRGNNLYVTTLSDLAGNPRIVHKIVDLGALEYQNVVPTPLTAPTLTEVTAVNSETIQVTWEAVEDASGYVIQYAKNKEFTEAVETDTLDVLTYTLTGLTANTEYFVRVKAVGTGEYLDSEYSAALSATTYPIALTITLSDTSPRAGQLLTTTLNLEGISVAYQWFRIDAQGNETAVSGAVSRRYKVTEADKGYYLKVTATVKRGDLKGASASASTNELIPLSTPKIVLMKSRGSDLTLTWRAVPDASSYQIEYSTDPYFAASQTVTSETTSLFLEGLTMGETYYFRVQAADDSGTYLASDWSDVRAYALVKLEKPTITGLKTEGDSISLTWNPVENADRYVVYYSEDAEFENYSYKVTTEESAVISGLTMGKTYYVKVQARSLSGVFTSSDFSVTRKITVNKLAAPSITSLTAEGTNVSVAWTASFNADRYILYYSTSKDFSTYTAKTTAALQANLTDLKAGKTYYFRVQARDSSGTMTASEFSSVVSIKLAAEALQPANDSEISPWEDDEFDLFAAVAEEEEDFCFDALWD